MKYEPAYYGDYLQLDKLLDSQTILSKKYGEEAHDEMLFVIVHQAYELWFKQIIHDFRSIVGFFSDGFVEESKLTLAVHRLERVIKIQGLFLDFFPILETMTPMDFLEFRNLIVPASGHQSIQFREIEIMMGLSTHGRHEIGSEYFIGRLNEKDRNRIIALEKEKTLLDFLNEWLERLPFTKFEEFDFWDSYRQSVEDMLAGDREIIESHPSMAADMKKTQLANLDITKNTFDILFDDKKYQESVKAGSRRLSRPATLNALFILLYRDEPMLSWPFKFLSSLMDIDENFTTWRHRHALLAQRMLGTKIGTGGSSGHEYLKSAADHNRVYSDLFNLSTFLIPRSKLPVLPDNLKKHLNFQFSNQ